MTIPTKLFLEILVKKGVISEEEAVQYEIESLKQKESIDAYLLNLNRISRKDILIAKSEFFKIPWVDVLTVPVTPQALSLISESIARRYMIVPYELTEQDTALKVAMADPFDLDTIEFLQKKTGKRIISTLALSDDVERALDIIYTQGLSPDIAKALKDVEPQVKTVKASDLADIIKEAPIAKIVTTTLEYAIKGRASDIHIEPQETKTKIRYRIDGVLQEKLLLPKGIHDSLISRIKILSGLKIDEKRIPQDGRFNFKMGDDEVDLRVSTLPTVHGEKVVMRLLKKTGGIPTLFELGFTGPQLKTLEEAVIKPYGIVLVTGPTGSGKSTTLYSILNTLNKPTVNIVTLEDPVEYQIPGINQVQINPTAGLTFATGLRAFLRQDPNIILVGEIRDKETTSLALQAALTGHMVFSTLHTNDAATSIPRLIDLGGEPFLIASVLTSIVAQRIVRRLCESCKSEYSPPQAIIDNIVEITGDVLPKQYKDNPLSIKLYKPKGCEDCSNSGYFGRIGIFEVLSVSNSIVKLIIQHSTARDIENQAKKESLISMRQDGYLKSLQGITTIEEVIRVSEV